MSDPAKALFSDFFRQELKELLREVIREEAAGAANGNGSETEALLTPEKAADIMGVEVRWLYRHAKQLPFNRKISRKLLRFSEPGLRRWLATRRA